jgi:hypothetical protein
MIAAHLRGDLNLFHSGVHPVGWGERLGQRRRVNRLLDVLDLA